MKKLLLLFLACLCLTSVMAQSADGRYVSRMTQDGTLFFIMPKKIKDLSGIKHFEYDMTLLTHTDSVTINFTFESPSMEIPQEFVIKSGNDTFTCTDYKPLFIDIKNNGYEVRITSKFSNDELKRILESPTPPIFIFSQGNQPKRASYRLSDWKKDRKKLSDIFNLYLYSK